MSMHCLLFVHVLAMLCVFTLFAQVTSHESNNNSSASTVVRRLQSSNVCDSSISANPVMKRYFDGMDLIYRGSAGEGTCYPVHKQCGWPSVNTAENKKLPLFVLSVGLEGAGHHLWTEILEQPVFDCVWKNARHYYRDIADGVPRATAAELKSGFLEQFQLRKENGKPPCKSIYDSEDSFPTGAIRQNGRLFMRPDIINLQQLDGVLFNVKYLLIIRNTTDTALSALRRNFFSAVDPELRTVEHTLTYVESAMRGVPCHKTFIAHYEHALADPQAFLEPLATFLELDTSAKTALKGRLSRNGKLPSRKAHKLTQYKECKALGLAEEACYKKISTLLDEFFGLRSFMWPTFAANGFDFKQK